jgi:hypothetical protein
MATRTFDELVQDLQQRREVADPPPVLLMGAGASIAAGIGAMGELFKFVKKKDFDEFCEYIKPLTAAERYRLLARFLQTRKPEAPTAGYQALAKLCAEAYFDIILTTNLDPLLDDALANARLWRKDYMLLVNGVTRPDRLMPLLQAQSPRLKVVKLHGDLFQRFMAWTPAEMDTYLTDIIPHLQPVLQGRDLLIVGYSMRDERVRELALSTGGAVWYMAPFGVPDFLASEERLRAVTSEEAKFENTFPALVKALGLAAPAEAAAEGGVSFDVPGMETEEPAAPISTRRGVIAEAHAVTGAETIDDFMASIVALTSADGRVVCTGFVLAEPRVIVTDGYVGNTQHFLQNDRVVVKTLDGEAFTTRVKTLNTAHPFGPLVLDVPDDFEAIGLRLDTGSLTSDMAVRIGVSAGERIGITKGVITSPRVRTQAIAGVGDVPKLATVEATVKPGSSGAPIVDDSFAVRGFIVAGADDKAKAFMYPASTWASVL